MLSICPPASTLQEPHRLLQRTMTHLTHHLRQPFLDRVLDDRPNVQTRPDLQVSATSPRCLFDLVTKCPPDACRIGRPAVCTDEDRASRLCASSHLPQKPIRQAAIARATDHPAQPESCRNHDGRRVANRRGNFAVPFSIGPLQTGRATFIAPSFPASLGYARP